MTGDEKDTDFQISGFFIVVSGKSIHTFVADVLRTWKLGYLFWDILRACWRMAASKYMAARDSVTKK